MAQSKNKTDFQETTTLLTGNFHIRSAGMARTRTLPLLMMAFGLVNCSGGDTSNQTSLSRNVALVESIEKQVLARHAHFDLRRYARLYTHTSAGNVEGTYFFPGIGGLPSKWEGGKSYWVKANEVPAAYDGGCAVINLLYNVPSETLVFVSCNGDA
ncbi:hypothetical protein [Blastomonas fulva]|uniref:hypothetical protein n=1 Tax=Blastomonas fulva TaxID=1550728 RepID=UPI0013C2DD98|nr:hypothetical protein [Blastomonas fulva]